MIVTYNWLKEFVDFDLSPEDLAHRLTMAGLEVDGMEYIGEGLDSVIVARLKNVGKHPEADRLTLCEVDTGSEVVPVVCGATNHRTGDLVAFAQVGSVLPGDFKIKKSKIRGEVSMGMLCSEKELGLAEESEGILILPEGLDLGTPVFEALQLKDVKIEIGLTPNRPDCLSILGVAREVAALTGGALKAPLRTLDENGPAIESITSVTIEDADRCPRYSARLIKGVRISPSPKWLVKKVESVGMRSINNVVDVTNFIMMELGQPMHAFDFSLLRGGRIVVKTAQEGEVFITLDGQERKLTASDLLICDGEGGVALAGIMGGLNSEVKDDTCDILLESAYFSPSGIRRTGRRLGLHTESSHRFERGTDIDLVPVALDRAAGLIQEVAGGLVAKGVIDVYPKPVDCGVVPVTTKKTNDILALDLDAARIDTLLQSIGLRRDRGDAAVQYYRIPTFRPDLEREIDLIEEVARLNGYDKVPTTMPSGMTSVHRPLPIQNLVRRVRDLVAGFGYQELVNYSFFNPSAFDKIALSADDRRRTVIPLMNPLTEDQSVMRTTLVPSMLETMQRNRSYGSADLQLFELRPVFLPIEGEEMPQERPTLCLGLTGSRNPLGWANERGNVDFYDLKGTIEALLDALGLKGARYVADRAESYQHPGKACRIFAGEAVIGSLAEIHPRVAATYDLKPVFLAEIDILSLLDALSGSKVSFKAISRFPELQRDSALLVDAGVTADQIVQVATGAKAANLVDVQIFDLYQGGNIPAGKKSIAVRMRYRSAERTLTDDEVTGAHERIIKALSRELAAEIR